MAEYLSEEERKATELALEAAKDAHSEKWWQQTWKTPEGEGTELSDLLCFFDDEGKPRFWNWMSVGEFVAHTDPSFVLSVLDRLDDALYRFEVMAKQNQRLIIELSEIREQAQKVRELWPDEDQLPTEIVRLLLAVEGESPD